MAEVSEYSSPEELRARIAELEAEIARLKAENLRPVVPVLGRRSKR